MTVRMRRLAVSVFLLAFGCTGTFDAEQGEGGEHAAVRPPEVIDPVTCAATPPTVGATPLRRLTQLQYLNTIALVLDGPMPADAETRLRSILDGREGGFRSSAGVLDEELVRQYLALADELAGPIAAQFAASCDDDSRCADALIRTLGRQLFRRPLAEADVVEYRMMYDEFAAEFGASDARVTVVAALLSSPRFLFHLEETQEASSGALRALDAYGLASRLSFFLFQSAPDETLLAAAEAGAFDTDAGIEAEVRQMLADPRAARGIEHFFTQWLELEGLSDVPNDDPASSPGLPAAMRLETLTFIEDVLGGSEPSLASLLTASYSFPNDALAELYGVAPRDGRVDLDPSTRAGFLTHPSFLFRFGDRHPEIFRGAWVLSHLLCAPPPPPPPEVPEADSASRLSTQPCATCHSMMDPLGFTFHHYDALGRFVEDAAAPAAEPAIVDPQNRLDPSLVGPVSGPRELAARLATSDDVHRCVSDQWDRFARGRAETEFDRCEQLELSERFIASGGDLRELIVSIATSPTFRARSASEY
ncbi:MAG: DUF1592 domain-containing protein [Myxococcota bacterium]